MSTFMLSIWFLLVFSSDNNLLRTPVRGAELGGGARPVGYTGALLMGMSYFDWLLISATN